MLTDVAADKCSRRVLILAISELTKSLKHEAVEPFRERCASAPYEEPPDAIDRLCVFVDCVGTILMIDGLHVVEAVSKIVQYKGAGIFERTLKAILMVDEQNPEATKLRIESRAFLRDAAVDVLRTAASGVIQGPKLGLCVNRRQLQRAGPHACLDGVSRDQGWRATGQLQDPC